MWLSRFSVESFSPQSAGTFRMGKLLCCFPEKFRQRKRSWKRGGGGGGVYHVSRRKIFCPKVPKKFVGEQFFAVFQKISGSEKDYG